MQGKPVEEWLLHSNQIMQTTQNVGLTKEGRQTSCRSLRMTQRQEMKLEGHAKKKIRKIKQRLDGGKTKTEKGYSDSLRKTRVPDVNDETQVPSVNSSSQTREAKRRRGLVA